MIFWFFMYLGVFYIFMKTKKTQIEISSLLEVVRPPSLWILTPSWKKYWKQKFENVFLMKIANNLENDPSKIKNEFSRFSISIGFLWKKNKRSHFRDFVLRFFKIDQNIFEIPPSFFFISGWSWSFRMC